MLARIYPSHISEVAPLFRYLLKPVALLAYVLAAWRVGADLNWTGEFFIAKGLFSHWQVWLVVAIATQVIATHLAPIANKGDDLILP